jgi:cell division protein FtsZ
MIQITRTIYYNIKVVLSIVFVNYNDRGQENFYIVIIEGKIVFMITRYDIIIIGVGRVGCHAVNQLQYSGINNVEYMLMDTDISNIQKSKIYNKMWIGKSTQTDHQSNSEYESSILVDKFNLEEIQQKLIEANLIVVITNLENSKICEISYLIADLAQEVGTLSIAITSAINDKHKKYIQKTPQNINFTRLKSKVDSLIEIPDLQTHFTLSGIKNFVTL